jgi:hypothetical protein
LIPPAALLLGTTRGGGTSDVGTVFQLSDSGGEWVETIVYSFPGAAWPNGGAIEGSSADLFGMTCLGGVGGGVLYELSPGDDGWTFSDLYSFKGPPNGECPIGTVTLDRSGGVYGVTQNGGTGSCQGGGCGTVFRAWPDAASVGSKK